MATLTDTFSRTITVVSSDDADTYYVDDGAGNTFNVSVGVGRDITEVMSIINSMIPPSGE